MDDRLHRFNRWQNEEQLILDWLHGDEKIEITPLWTKPEVIVEDVELEDE